MAVVFDTLEYANRLERAGFTRDQAAAQIQALVAVVNDQVATKADLDVHQAAMRQEFEAFGGRGLVGRDAQQVDKYGSPGGHAARLRDLPGGHAARLPDLPGRHAA